jgi:hypothetical protein
METLVEEGEGQARELDGLLGALPPPDALLRLREGCKMRICDFTPAELEVFQGLIRHRTLAAMVEESAMTDLRVLSLAQALVVKRVFEVEENSSLLEQTHVFGRQ